MLNHRIRGLLFHYKQIVILQLASIFLGKSIQKHPDSVVENDVNKDQNVLYVKPLNERLIILLQKKLFFWLLFSGKSIHNILILSVRMRYRR